MTIKENKIIKSSEHEVIINLTQHVVNVYTEFGIYEFEPSGVVARVSEDSGQFTSRSIPESLLRNSVISFRFTEYSEPIGLPPVQSGKVYIVSSIVKSALPDRDDLVVPKDFVRDDSGNIIGCRALSW